MAYAVKNCVIVGEDDFQINYTAKCEKCGWTFNNQAAAKSPSFDTFHSMFLCPQCQEQREVFIKY